MRPQSSILATCEQCARSFTPSSRPSRNRPAQRFCSSLCSRRAWLAPIRDQFMAKVVQTDGCWPRPARLNPQGYGRVKHNGRSVPATHMAWFLASGEWPTADQRVGHTCDYPTCTRNDGPLSTYEVNGVAHPRYGHLFLTTPAGNNADMAAKGRAATGDRNGARIHPLPGEQNANAILTADQVRAIRARYAAGGVTLHDLGAEYGVNKTTVHGVVRRRSWKHIA